MSRKRRLAAADLSIEVLEQAIRKDRRRRQYKGALTQTINALATVALLIVIAVLVFPVLRISGGAMGDTLRDGDIVLALRGIQPRNGDVVAMQYGANKILIRRLIAGPGEEISLGEDGALLIGGQPPDEPYVTHEGGEIDLELPLTVPEEQYFVMGDNRALALDSRNEQFGCVSRDQIIGPVILKLWPLEEFGLL